METPHSVERNDRFPVTLEIKSSGNLYGCLRFEAWGRATLKQKDRNAKADKITEIWMGRHWPLADPHRLNASRQIELP
jgi:hypothetical protein